MDEPSAGLDPASRLIVFELIEELKTYGVCIILTTHLLEDAQRLADHVVLIRDGRVEAAGSVHELTSTELRPPLEFGLSKPLTAQQRSDFPPQLTILDQTSTTGGYSWRIAGVDTPADLHVLTSWLVQHDLMPTHLGMSGKTLEDVFWELTVHDKA